MEAGLIPQAVLDRYRVIEQIGVGGNAAVFRGTGRTDLGLRVAIKLLHDPVVDAQHRRRFRRECNVLRRLNADDRVVSLIDHGITDAGRAFLVMPLYDGTWSERLRSQGRVEESVVAEIAIDVATALDAAHRNGVVHRDVKPSNMFVDDDGRTVLGDFGAAGLVDSRTLTTSLALSIPFAAPEVLERGDVSPASDLYALGASLCELLTGELPFGEAAAAAGDTAGLGALIERVRRGEPPRLDGVEPALRSVVLALLAKDPADRPPSGQAVIEMLESGPSPAARSVTRRGLWIPAAAAATVVAFGGLAFAASDRATDRPSSALIDAPSSGGLVSWIDDMTPEPEGRPNPGPFTPSTSPSSTTPVTPTTTTALAVTSTTVAPARTATTAEPIAAADREEAAAIGGAPDASAPPLAPQQTPASTRPADDVQSPVPAVAPAPATTTTSTSTTTSTTTTTATTTSTTTTTLPAGPCGGARACENFDSGIESWTVDADEGAGRISTTQRKAFSGADSLGAIPSDDAVDGSLEISRVFGLDPNAAEVHFRFRLRLEPDGAEDYWASIFVARDISQRTWRLNLRDVEDGATFGLWTDRQDIDGYGGTSSTKTVEYRRWHCIDVRLRPGEQNPMRLSVDGAPVAETVGPPSGAMPPEIEVFLGLPALREPAAAPDVFIDDFEIDPVGDC